MPNLRIVHDNAVDRSVTLSASSTAGTLVAGNMKTDIKTEVWRSASAASYVDVTLTWTNAEDVQCVAVPICNLSSAATLQVFCYTNSTDASGSWFYQSGIIAACPGAYGSTSWGSTAPGVNSYAFGSSTYAVVWLPAVKTVKKVLIRFTDTANSAGYIEASKLVIGKYWTPTNNCAYGVDVGLSDGSKHSRDDAGNLRTERGTTSKTLSLDLQFMPAADRDALWRILRMNGMYKPVYLHVTPESTDAAEDQQYQIYGKLSKSSRLKYQFSGQFDTALDIEEV